MIERMGENKVSNYGSEVELRGSSGKPEAGDIPATRMAIKYYREGNFSLALEKFRKVLEHEPGNPDILFNISLCLFRGQLHSSYNEMVGLFDKIIGIESNYRPAWVNKGVYLASCGDLLGGLECFNRALKIEETSSVLENRGNILLELGNAHRALDDYTRSIELGGRNSSLFYHKGVAMMEVQRFPEALELFDRANEMGYPHKDEMEMSRAEMFLGLGKLGDALSSLEKVLEGDPENLRAIGMRGIVHHYSGLDEYSRTDLTRAREIAKKRGLEHTQLMKILEKILSGLEVQE